VIGKTIGASVKRKQLNLSQSYMSKRATFLTHSLTPDNVKYAELF